MKKRLLLAAVVLLGFASTVVAVQCDVEVLFLSPPASPMIEERIIEELDAATSQILVAMYSFTDDALGTAVVRAHQRGVSVYVLMDEAQDSQMAGREWPTLLAAGIPSAVEHEAGVLNHRFVVIDQQIVITGSCDWSERASSDDFENVVILDCSTIAQQFVDEFFRVSDAVLGLDWEQSAEQPSSAGGDPCWECLARLNASTRDDFVECSGVTPCLAYLLEEYRPYRLGSCSQPGLVTILLGIPGLELPLAQDIIDCICEGLFD